MQSPGSTWVLASSYGRKISGKGASSMPLHIRHSTCRKRCVSPIYVGKCFAHIGPNNIDSFLLVFLSSAVELLGAAAKYVRKPILTRRSSANGFHLQSKVYNNRIFLTEERSFDGFVMCHFNEDSTAPSGSRFGQLLGKKYIILSASPPLHHAVTHSIYYPLPAYSL